MIPKQKKKINLSMFYVVIFFKKNYNELFFKMTEKKKKSVFNKVLRAM